MLVGSSVADVEFSEVERVLDVLDAAKIRYWVAGGWGVAALVGAQTRDHRDLDLAVDSDDLVTCLQCLATLGYRRETDWLPVRVEYTALGWAGSMCIRSPSTTLVTADRRALAAATSTTHPTPSRWAGFRAG